MGTTGERHKNGSKEQYISGGKMDLILHVHFNGLHLVDRDLETHTPHSNILPPIFQVYGDNTLHTPQPITQDTTNSTHTFKRIQPKQILFIIILLYECS